MTQAEDQFNRKLFLGVLPPGVSRKEAVSSEESDAEFKKIRPVILQRDNYTCQYCGHYAVRRIYQEVHHINGDHSRNEEDNLITVCHFCHMPQHLWYALQCGAILVAWDYPQVAISRFTRKIMQAGKRFPGGEAVLDMFREGKDRARRILGDDVYFNLPQQMQYILVEAPDEYRQLQEELYENGIRMAFPPGEYNKAPSLSRKPDGERLATLANPAIIEKNEPAWSNRLINASMESNFAARYAKFANKQ